MVNSPKKKKYNLWTPKGQKTRALICLMAGNQNAKTITKLMGCKKAGWLYRLINDLKIKGYIKTDSLLIKDSKGRDNRKPVYILNIKFFLDYAKEVNGLSFTNKEISWLKKEMDTHREDIVINSFWKFKGSLIKSLLDQFAESLVEKNIIKKKEFIGLIKKLWILIINQSYSPGLEIYKTELGDLLEEHYKNDYEVIEDLLEKYGILDKDGIDIRNNSEEKFIYRLIHSFPDTKFDETITKDFLSD